MIDEGDPRRCLQVLGAEPVGGTGTGLYAAGCCSRTLATHAVRRSPRRPPKGLRDVHAPGERRRLASQRSMPL
jgi:hypothetical protein